MTLYINTTDFDNVKFALIDTDYLAEFSKQLAFNENFQTLGLLEKFFKKEKVSIKHIKKIVVCSGPGSFTGIRVGVSMAMAMGFALNIPVITIAKSKVPKELSKLASTVPNSTAKSSGTSKKLSLNYGQKPNITPSKKKIRK